MLTDYGRCSCTCIGVLFCNINILGALIAQGSEEVIKMTKMAERPWHGITLDPVNDGDLRQGSYLAFFSFLFIIRNQCTHARTYMYVYNALHNDRMHDYVVEKPLGAISVTTQMAGRSSGLYTLFTG